MQPMAKAESRSALTPAQWEIMNLLWEHGELGVAQVWKLLGQRRSIARNTVQTTLTRLAEKGWLRVRAEGNTFYFAPARQRESALRGVVGQLIDTAFSGSASGLVATLLADQRLSVEEARRIRELIERAERRKQ
jgi:predicted transcriptional regulator